MSVGWPEQSKLNQWCYAVTQVFGGQCYHVGSSLKSKKWRDVDIICIVADETFLNWAGPRGDSFGNWRWEGLCTAFSEWGRVATGLPIDFKLQSRSIANDKTKHPGGRSALGIRTNPLEGEFEDTPWRAASVESSK